MTEQRLQPGEQGRIEIVQITEKLAEKHALAATIQAELAEQRARADKAEQTVRAAQDAAEALRQAEATRRAMGRLRRAWDGWRGR